MFFLTFFFVEKSAVHLVELALFMFLFQSRWGGFAPQTKNKKQIKL